MIHSTDDSFTKDISGKDLVLVKVGAPWCGPCKSLEPILESLEVFYAGKVKFVSVNIDDTSIAAKYSIRSVPTLLLFHNGIVIKTIVGAKTRNDLTALITENLLNLNITELGLG